MATFGKTTVGAGTRTSFGLVGCCRYRLPEPGLASKLTLYCRAPASAKGRCALYTIRDGLPDKLLAVTAEVDVDSTAMWRDFPFPEPVKLDAGEYGLAYMFSSESYTVWFDPGEEKQTCLRVRSYVEGFPDPFGSPGLIFPEAVSIYGTYTPIAVPPVEWLPIAIGGFAPIIFGLAVIGYTELTKKAT